MVSSKILALGLAAVTSVFAAPAAQCMSAKQAQQVATNFGNLIANYSDALANASLTVNYTDYSESVNTLIDECPQGSAAISLPLLSATFSSRAQFEKGQAQQPSINFQQLNIWHTCNAVTFRWMTTNTAPIANPKPVVGVIVAETVKVKNTWKIDTIYSEFDAGAWLENLVDAGICPSDCSSSTSSSTSTATATASTSASTSAAASTTATASTVAATTSTAAAASSTAATSISTVAAATTSSSA